MCIPLFVFHVSLLSTVYFLKAFQLTGVVNLHFPMNTEVQRTWSLCLIKCYSINITLMSRSNEYTKLNSCIETDHENLFLLCGCYTTD